MTRTSLRWTAVCVVLGAIIAYAAMTSQPNQGSQPKNVRTPLESQLTGLLPHGEVKDGLAAFLACELNSFKLGQPVPLSYGILCVGLGLERERTPQEDLKNVKLERRIWWLRMRPELRYNYSWFEVTDPDGQNVPYRGGTAELKNYSLAPSGVVQESSVVLYHRQFVGMVFADLRENFDLAKPGVYRVRWGYDAPWKAGPWTGRLMSNEIQVEIVNS